MAELYEGLEKVPTYYDRRTCTSLEDWKEAVRTSRAVYVGNLNYFTTEEELYEVGCAAMNTTPAAAVAASDIPSVHTACASL